MKIKPDQINRSYDQQKGSFRLALFHGPDESGARAWAEQLAKAFGSPIERVDMKSEDIKDSPGLLANEASSLSLFGDKQYIRIDPAGDELAAAVEIFLAAETIENPVIIIAPTLKSTSKLVKLADAHLSCLSVICYAPEGVAADQIAMALAGEQGLRLTPDVARRIVTFTGNDRAIIARELEKLALYLDAEPAQPQEVTHAHLDSLGAAHEEGNLGLFVDAVLQGRLDLLDDQLSQLESGGNEGIPVLAALRRRLLLLADLRAQVDAGSSPDAVIEKQGKAIFFKEKNSVRRQLTIWPSDRLAIAIERLLQAEQDWKSSGSLQSLALDMEMIVIGRVGERLNRR